MKNIVCLDLDDTICDTYSTIMKYARRYNKYYLKKSNVEKNISSDDYYYFARNFNWTRDELIKFFELNYPEYLKHINPIKNVSNIINKIRNMNLKIVIITSRKESIKENVMNITKKWLKDNDINVDNIIINCDNKDEIVKKMSASYFVDDSLKNCLMVREKCPYTKVYLRTTIYNKNLDNGDIIRINNLEELYEEIRRLECKIE